MSQGLSEGFHFFSSLKASLSLYFGRRLRPRFSRRLSAGSLPPIRASARGREHMKTFAIFTADGAKAAHSNQQGHARGTQGGTRARLRSEKFFLYKFFIMAAMLRVAGPSSPTRVFRVWSGRCRVSTSPRRRSAPARQSLVSFWPGWCAGRPGAGAIS